MLALLWILMWALLAISGYLITPDSTPYANRQNLELSANNPGFQVTILKVATNTPPPSQSYLQTMIWGQPDPYETIPLQGYEIQDEVFVARTYTGDPDFEGPERFVYLPDIVFALDSFHIKNQTAEIWLLDGTHKSISLNKLEEIVTKEHITSRRYLLGTDRFGRDLLSQIIIGARVSLSVGFIAISIALLVGLILGSVAGFFRGKTDDFIVWLINVVWSIPTLLLVIAITFALGKGFWQVFIAVGLTMWVDVARVVRGQIISLRENEYIEAARALGLPNLRIIRRHILPNILGPVVVISAANFASAILIEAGLSFLGIGVQPPMPSWGSMIKENYGFIILDKAFLAIIPGLCIMSLVMAFMLVGNGLRDALDKSPLNY